MVEPIQDMIEEDLLSGGAGGIEFLDSGESGLPTRFSFRKRPTAFPSSTAE